MKYKLVKIKGNSKVKISIRLDDQCNNGHQDFAITADLYEKTKREGDHLYIWEWASGGCVHDAILRIAPELKQFVDLHLCDFNGCPMYAVANGFYSIREDKMEKDKFCESYRVSKSQYNKLVRAENKLEYAILLEELGIIKQWKVEAKEAIKVLERLTGVKFKNTSVRDHYNKPSLTEVKEFKKLKAEGYYTLANKKKRAIEAEKKAIEYKRIGIENDFNKTTDNAETERAISLLVLKHIGHKFDNYIYYKCSNQLVFNWAEGTYRGELTNAQFKTFLSKLTPYQKRALPKGIKIELGKGE